MSTQRPIHPWVARRPAQALLSYAAAVVALLAVTWVILADLNDKRRTLAAATDLLEQMEGRKPGAHGSPTAAENGRTGSPFLEGQTVTVAGAALQQRVNTAVTKVGGNVLSSQVDLQGNHAKDGFVSLITSCEVDQPSLQQLLYDIEAGMPFLFVDQLVVQGPQGGSGQEPGGRMRVLLAVSGQWQAAKLK